MKTIKKGISLFLVVVMLLCASSLFAQAKEIMYYDELFFEVSLELLQEYIEENGYVNRNGERTLSYSWRGFDTYVISEYDGVHFYGYFETDNSLSQVEMVHDKSDYTRGLVTITTAFSTWSFQAYTRLDLLNFIADARNQTFTLSSTITFDSEMRASGQEMSNTLLASAFLVWDLLLDNHGWYSSEIGFANYCPGHTKTLTYESEEATCSSAGTQTTLCAFCGWIMKEETIPAGGHQWNAGVVTKPASCDQAGVKTYTCNTCGQTKTETIPAGSHQWNAGVVTKPASCDQAGVMTYTCNACGQTRTETIPAGSHQWNAGVVTKPASCGEAGVMTYTCNACGQIKTEAIPAAPHQWGAGVVTSQASCNAAGIRTYTCLNCGQTKTETIPAGSHQWGAGVVLKQASCIETGAVSYTCRICGTTRTEATPNTPHTFVSTTTPATTTRSGLIVSECSICGEVKSTNKITRIGKVTLSKTSYVYNGSAKTPKVTVKDANGNTINSKYYTVKYAAGRTEIGTYKVKIVFKGRYSGSLTSKFKIVPGRTTDLKGASSKKGIAKLTWSRVDGAQKYVIYAAESKNGTYEKVATTKGLAYNVKNLSSGTKTYFIVKALTKADGKNYYGTKSNVAAVKVK